MEYAYHASKAVSVAAFLFYGLSCLVSDGMVAEFERFGLSRFRRLTGALEVLGALGLLGGYFVPQLDVIAAAGLAALMVLGVITRIRVGDRVVDMLPAIILLLINGHIAVHALGLFPQP